MATTLDEFMAEKNKSCGDGTVFMGGGLKRDPPRIPSGIFTVDYVTGGGFPIYGTTCLWGPDSSSKSTMAISTMAAVQYLCWRCFKFSPDVCSADGMTCECSEGPLLLRSFWADAEGTLDADWVTALRVEPDRYMVGLADYGEQYVNLADAALQADDCGLVIIDSLASLIPSSEFDAPMENQFVAVQARLISRCVRKLKQRLVRERKRGHPCTLLVTNQMRSKVGVLFGSPETMAGGFAMKHEFSLLLRCVKKSLKKDGPDAKFVDTQRKKEVAQRFSFSVRKAKIATLAGIGEYVRLVEHFSPLGLRRGEVNDYSVVYDYAKEYDIIEKVSKGYSCMGKVFPKVASMEEYWKANFYDYLALQHQIIAAAKRRIYNAE